MKYVGKTINLKSRMKSHQSGIGKFRLGAWLGRLKEKGLCCQYRVLEEHEGEGWELRERYWIGYYQNLGADLCNLSNGGEGKVGRKLSEESCQKLRDAFKGRPIPQEQREQISKSLTGKVQTTETVQRRLTKINERRIAAGLEPHKAWGSYEEYRKAGRAAYNITRQKQRRERGQLVKGSENGSATLRKNKRCGMPRFLSEKKLTPLSFA